MFRLGLPILAEYANSRWALRSTLSRGERTAPGIVSMVSPKRDAGARLGLAVQGVHFRRALVNPNLDGDNRPQAVFALVCTSPDGVGADFCKSGEKGSS